MQLANKKAGELNHAYIGTEHILFGLLNIESTATSWAILMNLHVDVPRLRCEIEKHFKPDPPLESLGKLPQTPRAKHVIEYAMEESRSLEHNYVGTEHLLLGLLREQEGLAALTLTAMGITLERTRQEMLYTLGKKERPIKQLGTETYLLHAEDDPANRIQKLMQVLQELDRTMDIKFVLVTCTRKA
ncbi:MAG TPA: Clp protease N-terminal domain-containing protein [Candidatus Peribacteraceae bacterium]|nr:Clp protease N-terminal domain-containing protein [Candidatus Peribacteraceae bacterium]